MSSSPGLGDNPPAPWSAQLGLWDAISLIVGIVVASSIFKAPPYIFGRLNSPGATFSMWILGGVLSLIGAFCYAELATTYPRSGGDYVYLTKAYGRFVGFLFGWSHLAGILTGSIGALAFVFADHAVELLPQVPLPDYGFAMLAVVGLSILNVFGLVLGKRTQNVLTILKTAGLLGVIVVGIGWGVKHGVVWEPTEPPANFSPAYGVALILVLYAFGGWSDASFVAAEVRNRERNLPWALIGGVGAITVIYLLVNLGYLMGLGFDGVKNASTPAAAVFEKAFGPRGSQGMYLLVMVAALGGVNGLILTGSRVHASLGADHRVFAWLGRWHPRWNSPVASLATQALVTVALITIVGTPWGHGLLNALNAAVGNEPTDWQGKFGGGFEMLVAASSPVFWFFFFLTGTGMMLLRWKDPQTPRPFRVPLFPLLPLVFCSVCVYMFYSSVTFAGALALIPVVPLGLGIVVYFASQVMGQKPSG